MSHLIQINLYSLRTNWLAKKKASPELYNCHGKPMENCITYSQFPDIEILLFLIDSGSWILFIDG